MNECNCVTLHGNFTRRDGSLSTSYVDRSKCPVHHPYTVDAYIVGAQPYPCSICGGPRQDERHTATGGDE